MGYLDEEKKSALEQKVFKNQVLLIICIFLYVIGIIILIFILPKSQKLDVLDIISVAFAPMSALGWFYFAKVLYSFKASVYNRFGSGDLYHQLFIFWGNRKLSIIALILALLLASLSFANLLEKREFEELKTEVNSLKGELKEAQKKLEQANKNLGEIRISIDNVHKQYSEELKKENQTSAQLKKVALNQQKALKDTSSKIHSLKKRISTR